LSLDDDNVKWQDITMTTCNNARGSATSKYT